LGKFLLLFPLVVVLGVAAAPARAGGFTQQEIPLQMDDGVSLAATLYLPTGTPPQGGWPAAMLFHGLGGTRASMAPIATGFLANQGYAVLAYDARGHGQSGGEVTLDGPREIADLRAAFDWFTTRPDVSDTRVGAIGFSYGGGALLRAAVSGVPFKALVPIITWTSLYDALAPQDLTKSGAVANFLQSVSRWDSTVYALAHDALASKGLGVLRSFAGERSSLSGLTGLSTPTFFMQGRRDFAFDISQATKGYRAVKGPRRLYIGDLGHAPAANPEAEKLHYLTEAREWLDRWLKGVPNGIDTGKRVELAPDPWTGKTYRYAELPQTKRLSFTLKGKEAIGAAGKIVRTVKLPRRALETFGSAVLRVSASSTAGWPHLVGVLSALTPGGKEIVVSEGGTQTAGLTGKARSIAIRFSDDATLIPSGSRLRLTLASASTAQNLDNLLYLDIGMPQSARVTIGKVTVTLPVLRKAISHSTGRLAGTR
jgi:predicted acyl esterase